MKVEYLSKNTLDELLGTELKGPAVTLYIPMTPTNAPPHITEKQIRVKNMIGEAATALDKTEVHANKLFADELRQIQANVHDDMEFWKAQGKGLLVTATPDMIRLFKLPYDTEEYCSVNDTFFLAPVISILNDAQNYFILTVVQQQPKLFAGGLYGLCEAELKLPENLEGALRIDELNQGQEQQASAVGGSMNTGGYNGRGGSKEFEDDDRLRFWRIIDEKVRSYLKSNEPLILAGTESEVVEYRNASNYQHILQPFIAGSYSAAKTEDLLDAAEQIVEQELIRPSHMAAIEEYEMINGANPERAANDKKTIEEAAEQGRVDKLLVRMTRKTTDVVRDTLEAAKLITFPEHDLSETINKLAIKVWQMSGSVIGLSADEIPNGAPMVARLRY